MANKSITPFNTSKRDHKKVLLVALILVWAIIGSCYLWYTWTSSNNEISKQAITKAETISTMINGEMIKKLHAVPEDVGAVAYESIKNRFLEWKKSYSDVRFVYLYTMKDDKLYIMVDSESVDSKDYSPPGQEYVEADKSYSMPLINGEGLITEPVTDRWGTWVSVLVPIKNLETGKIIAVLGMDYPVSTWNSYIHWRMIQASIMVFFLALLILAFIAIITKKNAAETANKALYESERSKSVLLSNLPGIAYRCSYDEEWTMVFISEGCYALLGYQPEELLNNHIISYNDIILPEDRDYVRKAYDDAVHSHQTARIEYRIYTADQKEIWVWEQGVPIYDAEGNVEAIEGLILDITERKELEVALATEKKLLETTLKSVGDGVISTDVRGNIVFMNKAAECLTGWTQEEAKDKPIEEVFYIINEFTKEKNENIVKKVLEKGQILQLADYTLLISRDGIARPIEDSAAPIIQENGEIVGVVLVFRDFSDNKQKKEEIEYLSYHDQLTGVYNRRYYEEALTRLDSEIYLPLTMVIGDVNGLKLVNDTFGHILGDEVLQKVAEVLKKGFRAGDVIARIGGDEFIILLPKTDSLEAEKIIKRITELLLQEKIGSIDISISLGYETKNKPAEKIQDIFVSAEDQMYKKKLFESPSMRSRSIQAITNALYEKNKHEELHSQRVSTLCEALGESLGLPQHQIQELKSVGLLHDIGKIAINEEILNKPGNLDEDEWKEIKRHPEIGYRILSTVKEMADMANYVLYHHERWDGNGYPKGLKEEQIPLVSRIIAIVEAYDAMTSMRNYHNGLCDDAVIEELKKNAGTQFDPELVNVFIEKVLNR